MNLNQSTEFSDQRINFVDPKINTVDSKEMLRKMPDDILVAKIKNLAAVERKLTQIMIVHIADYLEVDHIQPRFVGGNHTQENLRMLCRNHNQFRYRAGV